MKEGKIKFIEKAKQKHRDSYDYSKVNYIASRYKVEIICKIHGSFLQEPASHLRGRGCSKCSGKYKPTTSEFIEEVKRIHENKYTYFKAEYINRYSPVTITCTVHGDFNQIAGDHLNGSGCTKCSNESHWRRSEYIKKAKGRTCIFYIIKCFNETEEFYKKGITMKSIKARYDTSIKMPYNFEVVSEIFGDAEYIWDLEKEEKIKLKEFNYQPKIEFGGSKTECFTKI